MKFIRRTVTCLALVIVFGAVIAGFAFIPAVQTWMARTALAGRPGLQGSIGSVMAGFGAVDVSDLRLEPGGAVLTVPSLRVKLPLLTALLHRKFLVGGLAAKGWTLDLTHVPDGVASPAPPGRETDLPQLAARALGAVSGAWDLPCDASLDGVDLEGSVLVAPARGENPVHVNVTVTGGGLAAGRRGALEFEATVDDPRLPARGMAAQARFIVTMESPRTIGSVEARADLSAEDGPLHSGIPFSAGATLSRTADGPSCTLVLYRGGRHLATVVARLPGATRRLEGTWNFEVLDSDLAPFAPNHPLPSLSAAGEGLFGTDPAFRRVHASGRVKTGAGRLGVLAPGLDQLGPVTLVASFDLVHEGRTLHVDQLSASLSGRQPVAAAESLQPLELDEETGKITAADPGRDALACSLEGLPLAWVPSPVTGLTFAGGDVKGDFVLRATGDGFALRAKAPVTASGLSARSAGRTVAQNLDLAVSLLGDDDDKGWRIRLSPLTISSAGRTLATVEGQVSRPAGPDQPIAVAAKWNADLDALASSRTTPGLGRIMGRSASGEFSAKTGSPAQFDGTLAAVGRDPAHSISASVHADVDEGGCSFQGQLKIASGPGASEVSIEGSRAAQEQGGRFDATLTGETVALEHLRLLAAPVLAAAGGAAPVGGKDLAPFWGGATGDLKLSFMHLKVGGDTYDNVGGTLYVRDGFIELMSGRWMLPGLNLAHVDGKLAFDGAAEFPYTLKAAATANEFDAAPLFPGEKGGSGPRIEGHFTITGTITGDGANVDDLIGRTQENFLLTSKGGIFRVLQTSVAESIPESPSHVSDTLGDAGSTVASFFGIKGGSGNSARNTLSRSADAVIAFTYEVAEIGFDSFTVTAIRGPDGSIRIANLDLTAPDEHLTGSGQIVPAAGLPLQSRPLSLDLRLGAKGHAAELLAKADLLSSEKDDQGYTMLGQPFRFLGSLGKIDVGPWHDLLVIAANRKSAPLK